MIVRCLVLSLLLCAGFTTSASAQTDCDVIQVYEKQANTAGYKMLNRFEQLDKIETLLKPAQLDDGSYELIVKRVSNNLYQVVDEDVYIETKGCFKIGFREEVVLSVERSGRGVLRFDD